MKEVSQVLQYSKVEPDTATPLIVEQEGWSLYTGKITKQEVVRYLLSVIDERRYEIAVDCGMAGDELVVPVFVYPLINNLQYDLYSSYGELSERYSETLEITDELVQFRLSASESTKYPARSIKSLSWVLQCLDINGNEVDNPDLIIDGENLSTGVKVYGTAKVSYTCERHSYVLTAPRREEALDNNYSGVIVGIVQGYAPVVFELEMPPTVDSFINNTDHQCGRVDTGYIKDSDKRQPIPDVPSRNLVTVIDYCSQSTIQEYLE